VTRDVKAAYFANMELRTKVRFRWRKAVIAAGNVQGHFIASLPFANCSFFSTKITVWFAFGLPRTYVSK
jgi:hypothetical protein